MNQFVFSSVLFCFKIQNTKGANPKVAVCNLPSLVYYFLALPPNTFFFSFHYHCHPTKKGGSVREDTMITLRGEI